MDKNPPKDKEESTPGGILIKRVFCKRKHSFAHALQDVLFQISHDKIVREILQNRCTAQFISDRVCEIFEQCVDDEKERFINDLLKRIEIIENVYLSKHIDSLQEIGQKLLSITNEQNMDEKHHVKQILALKEQVKALQNEITKLHKLEAEKAADVENLDESEEATTVEPDGNHFFAYVDLTEMMAKLKVLEAESKSLKEVYLVFFKNMVQINKLLRSKIKKKIASVLKSKQLDLAEIEKQKEINKQIKKEYEEKTIPEIKNEMCSVLKKTAEQNNKMKKEMEMLREELARTKNALQQKETENEMMKETIRANDEKDAEMEKTMQNAELEIKRLKTENAEFQLNSQTKDDRVNKLLREKALASKNLETANQKNSELIKERDNMEKELKNIREELVKMKNQVPILEDENINFKETIKELTEKNEDLEKTNDELNDEINDLNPQLQFANSQLEQMKEKLEKLTEQHSNLQKQTTKRDEQMINGGKEIARLETELESKKQLLTSSEEKVKNLQKINKSQNEQNSQLIERNKKLADKNEQLQKAAFDNQVNSSKQNARIEALNEANEELAQSKLDLEKENLELNEKLSSLNNYLETTKSELNKVKGNAAFSEQKITELTAQNNNLTNENMELRNSLSDNAKYHDLLSEANEKNRALSDANKELTKQIHDLASVAKDAKAIVDEVQKYISINNPQELGKILQDMKAKSNSFNELLAATGENNVDSGIAQINEMKKANALFSKIRSAFPNMNAADILNQINMLRNENNRLSAEQKRIFGLLSAEPNVDISETIKGLVENQKKAQEEIANAGDFISEILSAITGQEGRISARLVFPMEENEKKKLLDVVKKIKKRSNNDHSIVEGIIEQSRQFGYSGNDALEASTIVAMKSHGSFYSTQQPALSPSAAQAELLKAKKQISKLRESLTKHMEMSTTREEELMKENTKLQEELSSEKLIHAEISRAWTTGNADMSYLKSKLNENEYSLVSYAQQMRSADRSNN